MKAPSEPASPTQTTEKPAATLKDALKDILAIDFGDSTPKGYMANIQRRMRAASIIDSWDKSDAAKEGGVKAAVEESTAIFLIHRAGESRTREAHVEAWNQALREVRSSLRKAGLLTATEPERLSESPTERKTE